MTADEISTMAPGKHSIIGFAGDWTDEHAVLEVRHLSNTMDGRARASVLVKYGRTTLRGQVVAGDDEVLCVRR